MRGCWPAKASRTSARRSRPTWPDQDAAPLIVAAVARLADAGEFDGQVIVGWCMEAYRDLYRRMVEVGDFAGALAAVKRMQDLAMKK